MRSRNVVVLSDSVDHSVSRLYADDTKRRVVTYNSHWTETKKSFSSTVFSTHKLYNCCSLILENDNYLALTHYDDTVNYLDDLLKDFDTKETRAYVVGGDTQHMYELLGKLYYSDVFVAGGYVDFYSGEDIDLLNSLPDNRYYNLLKSFVSSSEPFACITNDIYELAVTSWQNARKDVFLVQDSKDIVVSVSDEQYRQGMYSR